LPAGTLSPVSADGTQAQLHILPFSRFDPWVGFGAGWRGYWMVDDAAGTSALQGVDLVRAQVGVDCHITQSFVITPTFGTR
jgi:outer membrane protein W